MGSNSLNVLLVDDYDISNELTKIVIERIDSSYQITTCGGTREAIKHLDSGIDFRMIYLDLDLPGSIGLSFARCLLDRGLARKTTICSSRPYRDYLPQGRAMGLMGFIPKSLDLPEFTEALKLTLDGIEYWPRGNADAKIISTTQSRIISLIRAGHSSKEVADKLGIKHKTVDSAVSEAMERLGTRTRAHTVVRAVELGLVNIYSDADDKSRYLSKEEGRFFLNY